MIRTDFDGRAAVEFDYNNGLQGRIRLRSHDLRF